MESNKLHLVLLVLVIVTWTLSIASSSVQWFTITEDTAGLGNNLDLYPPYLLFLVCVVYVFNTVTEYYTLSGISVNSLSSVTWSIFYNFRTITSLGGLNSDGAYKKTYAIMSSIRAAIIVGIILNSVAMVGTVILTAYFYLEFIKPLIPANRIKLIQSINFISFFMDNAYALYGVAIAYMILFLISWTLFFAVNYYSLPQDLPGVEV